MDRDPASRRGAQRADRPADADAWDERRPWPPPPRRRQPLWATAPFAALLGVALVVLVAAAILLPGVRLGLPAGSGGTPAPAGATAVAAPSTSVKPTFVRPTPTPMPTFLAYVVRPGDSLNSIARQHDTTARSIAFWSREVHGTLDPLSEAYAPDRIEVGWTLLIIPGAEYDEDDGPVSPTDPAGSAHTVEP